MFKRKPKNKQLFTWYLTAVFEDGHVIEQTDDNENGSSVMLLINKYAIESPLIEAELSHIDGKQRVTVDLINGSFIVNGTPMEATSDFSFDVKIDPKTKRQIKFVPKNNKLDFQYWREKTQTLNATATVMEDKSVEYSNVKSRESIGKYYIGWKSGKHQAILAVG
jgi:hypothetical protein